MPFETEKKFENALTALLTTQYGWENEVLKYKDEKELIQNWKNILFNNNRGIDKLNNCPLTDGEMQQILTQISNLKTPLKLNSFINGRSVTITRDNPDDEEHIGKTVSLKIYDRNEIAAGSSRYQIARQPKFKARTNILPDRRGDFILLINGMPLIHVELKRSGIPVSQACNQIELYAHEGVFTGLFSLIQVFVAMNPEETVYFANPGPEGRFNRDFYFHWADFNNDPMNEWKNIAKNLLSIPMAHQLIGFYTVADNTDGILKVMRSYQYYAANKISDIVRQHNWSIMNQRGGYVWHTTGSGKTLTSFKAAQLTANSGDADKVVFLVDRIELGTQSANEYRGFAEATIEIQETEDTAVLVDKLKSKDPSNTLIVTSIQKMSNLTYENGVGLNQVDLDKIQAKKIVFIVDECHRSTFGEMMSTVKETFTKALFFGFSGTPIQIENQKKGCNTADVFGNELHRYSIANGIRDKNVLGFDPYMVSTFKEADARKVVALEQAKASTEVEALEDPKKKKIYLRFMTKVKMGGHVAKNGRYVKGIEDYLNGSGQYRTPEHREKVIEDIRENWITISHNYKFHGLLATSSIAEAIEYYRSFKQEFPELKVTALFDPSIDFDEDTNIEKEEALKEIINDYNTLYQKNYTISTHASLKKDIQWRLAHKGYYQNIENTPKERIDLLIVVDQMLTGFDSKWINVLYIDKKMEYENIIQAFSRTNRLFGEDKPHGIIKYYKMPHTMKKNIEEAVQLYAGEQEYGMFVVKLDKNLENINAVYTEIDNLFKNAGINNFEKLPDRIEDRKQFAKLFNNLNGYLESAKVQGFVWTELTYSFDSENGENKEITVLFNDSTYKILLLRYKELIDNRSADKPFDTPYDLKGYLTSINTDDIDAEYMNRKFEDYKKALLNNKVIQAAREELHKEFAKLTREEQRYAELFLHDIQTGDLRDFEPGKTFKEYIHQYMANAKKNQIHAIAVALGLNEDLLEEMISLNLTERNINEYGRFDNLKRTVDIKTAKAYFDKIENDNLNAPMVNMKVNRLLEEFILQGGFEIECDGEN